MPNLSVGATIVLTATDLASSVILTNRSVPGILNAQLTSYYFEGYRMVPNSADDLPMPVPSGKAQVVYVKNLAASGSGLNVTVQLSPVGGTKQLAATLTPGSMILLQELDTSQGWQIVELAASAGSIPCEVLIGA